MCCHSKLLSWIKWKITELTLQSISQPVTGKPDYDIVFGHQTLNPVMLGGRVIWAAVTVKISHFKKVWYHYTFRKNQQPVLWWSTVEYIVFFWCSLVLFLTVLGRNKNLVKLVVMSKFLWRSLTKVLCTQVPQVPTSNMFDLYNGLGMAPLVSNLTIDVLMLRSLKGIAWKIYNSYIKVQIMCMNLNP